MLVEIYNNSAIIWKLYFWIAEYFTLIHEPPWCQQNYSSRFYNLVYWDNVKTPIIQKNTVSFPFEIYRWIRCGSPASIIWHLWSWMHRCPRRNCWGQVSGIEKDVSWWATSVSGFVIIVQIHVHVSRSISKTNKESVLRIALFSHIIINNNEVTGLL